MEKVLAWWGSLAQRDRRVLVIAADERYLPTDSGKLFSTGNHPVETLGPIMHLRAAGYEIEVATPSGAMVKLEHWAVPAEDEAVKAALDELMPQLREPRPLDEVVAEGARRAEEAEEPAPQRGVGAQRGVQGRDAGVVPGPRGGGLAV